MDISMWMNHLQNNFYFCRGNFKLAAPLTTWAIRVAFCRYFSSNIHCPFISQMPRLIGLNNSIFSIIVSPGLTIAFKLTIVNLQNRWYHMFLPHRVYTQYTSPVCASPLQSVNTPGITGLLGK